MDDRIITAAAGRNRLRASDSDRERVLDMLKAAFVQGRLTKDELDARIGQTLASRTWGDLRALTDDIPAWPLPRIVRKPARPSSSAQTPAVVKAVACAIVALSAVMLAGMPGIWTMPAPPSMSAQACQIFDGWKTPGGYDRIAMLSQAVGFANRGSDFKLASDLTNLQEAYQRWQGIGTGPQPQAANLRYANQVSAGTTQVTKDCRATGY